MKHPMHTGARCAVLLAICLSLAPGASAAEGKRLGYQGAYWGVQTHLGMILSEDASPGPAYGVSARLATLASLLDIQAMVLAGHYGKRDVTGNMAQIDRVSVGVEGHAHPFMVFILQGGFFYRWLAGLYGSLGLDLDMSHVRSGPWHFDPGFKLGLGSDVEITDADVGWGLWLGVSYHHKLTRLHVPDVGSLSEHVFMLTLGYRNNDIYFMRASPPEEVQYRDYPLDD